MAGEWYNLDLPAPKMKDADDRRVMAKFVAALMEKFTDIYTYMFVPSAIWDANLNTGIQVEESTDENIIRMDASGTEIVTADNDQFAVNSGIKLGLEGNAGDTYWKYNSVTTYLEGWVEGIKRIEL